MAWIWSRDGSAAVEYALMAVGFAAGLTAAILLMGDGIELVLGKLGRAMDSISSTPGAAGPEPKT